MQKEFLKDIALMILHNIILFNWSKVVSSLVLWQMNLPIYPTLNIFLSEFVG